MTEKLYQRELHHSGLSFEEIIGAADPLCHAVGSIAMNFAVLENEISSAITYLLRVTAEKGLLVTAEMSFRAKLDVMASLMLLEYKAATDPYPIPEADFKDLLHMCQQSEELRNRLLHSSWVFDHAKDEVRRLKLSAKRKNGFVRHEEPLTPGQVVDIADYIIYSATMIDEFFSATYEDYEKLLPEFVK